MRRLMMIIGLEAYALLLAVFQIGVGVRTDEAKYLLDIPYPHPPLGRWILSLLDGWSYQELFWRVIFATLLIQAVWLILDLARDRTKLEKCALAGSWLFSAAVVFQAGTVMMAPLTALQGFVFIWLLLRGRDHTGYAAMIGLFWLASLFTAYQAVLFAPLVLGVILKLRIHWWQKAVLFLLPFVLLDLYTGTNPLSLASMLNHAGKDVSQTLLERFTETGWVYALGGSIILGIVGLLGILFKPRWPLILTFLLIFAYVFLSRYDYYAILFTPLLVIGFLFSIERFKKLALPVTGLVFIGTLLMMVLRPPALQSSMAHAVMTAVQEQGSAGDVLIEGSFGHEWQYASDVPVRRYRPALLQEAGAVICLQSCPDMNNQPQWVRLESLPVEVWVLN